MTLDGRKLIVVGGTSGMGHAIAETAASQGADVTAINLGIPSALPPEGP